MPVESPNVGRSRIREFMESMGRIVWGEPARIVRRSEWERINHLAYREKLREAAERGDVVWINEESERNQLTGDELRRLAQSHTPLEAWPDADEDLMGADAIGPKDPNRTNDGSAPS